MMSEPSAIKVLLDSHTYVMPLYPRRTAMTLFQTPIISLASTQSTLLSHQVYLTDRIDNKKRDRMAHLKCICFLHPSPDRLGALADELREPKYGEHYLCQWVNHAAPPLSCVDLDLTGIFRRLQQYLEQSRHRASGRGG